MKLNIQQLRNPLILFFLIILSAFHSDQNLQTAGNVDFAVKTVTYNGDRSPKNIVAIWVEDASGNFVKTLMLRASVRKQWLITWNQKSGGSTIDAVTGATLNNHQKHTVTWDCTDEAGAVVEDGEYRIVVEFTEEHAQGPLTSVSFSKTGLNDSVSPPDETNFIEIKLVYGPDATGLPYSYGDEHAPLIFPNPFTDRMAMTFMQETAGNAEFRVYGMDCKMVHENINPGFGPGEHTLLWNGTDPTGNQVRPGIYLVELRLPGGTRNARVIKF